MKGWRKLLGAIIGMGAGVYLITQGQYELGAGLVGSSLAAFSAANIIEHKIESRGKNGKGGD